MKQIRSEKAGVIGLAILFCILAIGAIGQANYQEQPKHPEGDREAASRQAVYTWDGYGKELDKVLKARGETK